MFIIHYSGTGNSAYVARRIANQTHGELCSLNSVLKNHKSFTMPNQTLVFVTPTYAWRLPRIVSDWIETQKFTQGQKVYFVMTCGTDFGNASSRLKALCDRKGLLFMGAQEVVMPENYIALYTAPPEEECEGIVLAADKVVDDMCWMLKAGKPLPSRAVSVNDKLKSGIVNNLFYTFIVKSRQFKVSDSCIGCGLCQQLCPLNNITLVDKKPHWGKQCTHCMACICHCPQQAIEYGNATKGKRRYYID